MRSVSTKLGVLMASVVLAISLAACGGGGRSAGSSLDAYPIADMSKYDCAADYKNDYQFVDMTVAQVAMEMDAGNSFVVYAGFDHCPWCNAMLNYLNDVAIERGIKIGYIDTRKDPSWQSNLDLADYDLFVEKFGSALPDDDEGRKHLYVPHVFFIKKGQLVDDHPGTVPSQSNSSDPLSDEQIAELRAIYNAGIDAIQ